MSFALPKVKILRRILCHALDFHSHKLSTLPFHALASRAGIQLSRILVGFSAGERRKGSGQARDGVGLGHAESKRVASFSQAFAGIRRPTKHPLDDLDLSHRDLPGKSAFKRL